MILRRGERVPCLVWSAALVAVADPRKDATAPADTVFVDAVTADLGPPTFRTCGHLNLQAVGEREASPLRPLNPLPVPCRGASHDGARMRAVIDLLSSMVRRRSIRIVGRDVAHPPSLPWTAFAARVLAPIGGATEFLPG